MNVGGLRARQWGGTRTSVVRRALVQFTLLSFLTLLVLAGLTAVLSRHIAREEAVRDAQSRSESIANVAAGLVDASVRAREADAMLVLDGAMKRRMRYASVTHILLWDADGRVLWADDEGVVGKRSALSDELDELVLSGGTLSEQVGDRGRHPGREPGEDDLLEVYVGTVDTDGVPFLFEAYIPPERVDQDYRAIFHDLLPMTLGMLVLLQVATLPLAISLARRIDRAAAHRSLLLRSSLQSWHAERRGLAQDLHDGVVQDLSAISYALPAVINQLPDDPSAHAARSTAYRMNDVLRQSLAALRSMVVDLSPDQFDSAGLAAALESVRHKAGESGLAVTLEVDTGLDLDPAVGGLVYRVVREGLRNVEKHAAADSVLVGIHLRDDVVEVVVTDDGRGVVAPPDGGGHDGLRLLRRFVADLGGTLDIGTSPTGGASLRVTIPVAGRDLSDGPS